MRRPYASFATSTALPRTAYLAKCRRVARSFSHGNRPPPTRRGLHGSPAPCLGRAARRAISGSSGSDRAIARAVRLTGSSSAALAVRREAEEDWGGGIPVSRARQIKAPAAGAHSRSKEI